MSKATESRIGLSQKRRKQLKALKRGGESYNSLLGKMIKQYDPEQGQ
jgi:hypothetical protein